jgi:branched-chain amino acid transport system substrate-binding protein
VQQIVIIGNHTEEIPMSLSRRRFVQGVATAGAVTLGAPYVRAQSGGAIRIGLLGDKTGPVASGGIDMERGLKMYLEERNYVMAGRKVELLSVDCASNPTMTRTKAQELVEKDKVHCYIGPLAAFEALAIQDYIKEKEIPTLSVAAAEDMTQRHSMPWFVRATSTSAQCAHPLAEYCAKTLGYKRMITIGSDTAYGQEMCAGFQRVFEDNGGKIIQKLWPTLVSPDYSTYISQLKTNADGLFSAFEGSNGFRFTRQFVEYGLKDKLPIVGGMTHLDEAVLRNMGDEALGTITSCWYSAELDNPINKAFAPAFRKKYSYDPGFYAAATYTNGAVLETAIKAVGGRVEDKDVFMPALRKVKADTCRGPVSFDQYGNVVGNVYIRKVTRKDGRLVNSIIKTYPNVSQFWTYDVKWFLAQPVYSRDYPPARFLEK